VRTLSNHPGVGTRRHTSQVISRADLPPGAGGAWTGLLLGADAPARPRLRVEVTSGRRLLIRQGDEIVLLARQDPQHLGVRYARTNRFLDDDVPPITGAQARDFAGDLARWAHWYVDRLSPVHAGRWTLVPGMPRWARPSNWPRLATDDPDRGHITWFGHGAPPEDLRDVLPLRRLSSPDAARVKSYRQEHADGILAPALLWWVSGLQTLLVLDGHDRIAAALAEGAAPPVLVLAPAEDPEWIAAASRFPTGDLAAIARFEGRTRAWPLPGGLAAWEKLAVQL
jgi:hypothetical protein